MDRGRFIGRSVDVIAKRCAKGGLIAGFDLERIDERRPQIAVIGA